MNFVRAYVDALDLTAVCVLAPAAGEPVTIRAGRDLPAILKRIRIACSDQSIEAKATLWCARHGDAKLIVATCNNQLPQLAGGWWAVSAPIAIKAVEIVAGDLGVAIETDASLHERAEAAVHRTELELERMKNAGDLRPVTRAYREYRLAREAEGKGAQSWCAWFANYKMELVRAAAQISPLHSGPCRRVMGTGYRGASTSSSQRQLRPVFETRPP